MSRDGEMKKILFLGIQLCEKGPPHFLKHLGLGPLLEPTPVTASRRCDRRCPEPSLCSIKPSGKESYSHV